MGEPLANDPSLRRARLSAEQTPLFDIASFQRFAQHGLVHRDVPEHPRVADVIETAANIAFQHPQGAGLSTQQGKALRNGVCRASARPKKTQEFPSAVVSETGRSASSAGPASRGHASFDFAQDRDSERAEFAVGLRDRHSPQRLRLVAAPPQPGDGFILGSRSAAHDSIHSGGSLAPVLCHSLHGQGFAVKRAGQQPW